MDRVNIDSRKGHTTYTSLKRLRSICRFNHTGLTDIISPRPRYEGEASIFFFRCRSARYTVYVIVYVSVTNSDLVPYSVVTVHGISVVGTLYRVKGYIVGSDESTPREEH